MTALEYRLGPRAAACLIIAAVVSVIVQATVRREIVTRQSHEYQPTSIPTEGNIVAVRFVPQASAADMTRFLDAYRASLVWGRQPGDMYRLMIRDAAMSREQLAKLIARISQEKIVEFVAAAK